MMSIFVCEEEELEHKVEKIDDEDDCYGSSEDMTESQLNASLYILGQAHYSKSLIYVQKCKSLHLDKNGLWEKLIHYNVRKLEFLGKNGFLEQCGSSYVKVTIISVSSFMNKMSSCLVSTREKRRSMSSQKTEKTLLLQGILNIMLYPQFISKVKDMQGPTNYSCSFHLLFSSFCQIRNVSKVVELNV